MADRGMTSAGAQRYESLDWLRGLLALSIMLYHLTTWDVTPLMADTLLGRLGVYGVSMFFVLSGLSIAVAYHRGLGNPQGVWRFGVRRVFRIWPLLWIAILTVTLIAVGRGEPPSWRMLALNLTTLFGFLMPSAYLNVGAWSIGNEMVYYTLTPLIVAAYNRSVPLGNALLVLTAGVAAVFAFRWLSPNASLASQWALYINPFNNLVLYTSGIALFYNATGPAWSKARSLSTMAVMVAVFAFYPVAGDQALIVTGANRIVFCMASVLLVLAFYKLDIQLWRGLASPLTQLGLATYGVYLLHPMVRDIIRLALPASSVAITIPLIIVATLIVAWFLYHRFELPMMQLGKRLAQPVAPSVHAR